MCEDIIRKPCGWEVLSKLSTVSVVMRRKACRRAKVVVQELGLFFVQRNSQSYPKHPPRHLRWGAALACQLPRQGPDAKGPLHVWSQPNTTKQYETIPTPVTVPQLDLLMVSIDHRVPR